MGKTVKDMLTFGNTGYGLTVIFLVKEKSSFLSIDHVNHIGKAIFNNDGHQVSFRQFIFRNLGNSLLFAHTFQLTDLDIIAFIDTFDALAHFPQHAQEKGKDLVFMAFHPKGQDLGDKDVVKAVHRQPRKAIGFAKDQAAAGKIRTGHNGLAIVHGIPNAALKKGLVKAVIGIIGKEADPDLGMVIVKTCADVFAFFTDNIDKTAIFRFLRFLEDFSLKDPRMTHTGPIFAFFGDCNLNEIAHGFLSFVFLELLPYCNI